KEAQWPSTSVPVPARKPPIGTARALVPVPPSPVLNWPSYSTRARPLGGVDRSSARYTKRTVPRYRRGVPVLQSERYRLVPVPQRFQYRYQRTRRSRARKAGRQQRGSRRSRRNQTIDSVPLSQYRYRLVPLSQYRYRYRLVPLSQYRYRLVPLSQYPPSKPSPPGSIPG